MSFLLDTHIHTQRHSSCSQIDPLDLIPQARSAGLDGLILTEHHYQWPQEELATLRQQCDAEDFLLLAGFEYSSMEGDILIYGLEDHVALEWKPYLPAKRILSRAQDANAVCIAAHPTRAGMEFGAGIATLDFDAIEVRSGNMQAHEQEQAVQLAEDLGLPGTVASDAHRIEDVGLYAMEFADSIVTMAQFLTALQARDYQILARTAGNTVLQAIA